MSDNNRRRQRQSVSDGIRPPSSTKPIVLPEASLEKPQTVNLLGDNVQLSDDNTVEGLDEAMGNSIDSLVESIEEEHMPEFERAQVGDDAPEVEAPSYNRAQPTLSDEEIANLEPHTHVLSSPVEDHAPQHDLEPTPLVEDESEQEPEPEPEAEEKVNMHVDAKSVNFDEKRPVVSPIDTSKRMPLTAALSAYPYPIPVIGQIYAQAGYDMSQEDANYYLASHTPQVIFNDRMTQEGADWQQSIVHHGKDIGPARPRFGTGDGTLKGAAAIEVIRKRSGTGSTITFPLIHSGIWVTMRPPIEAEMIDLDFRLTMERQQVGLSTTGLLLNARSGVFSNTLVDFALDHVSDTNVKNLAEGRAASLKARISSLDYNTLIWGLLTTLYPDGYPWEFKCPNPKCNDTDQVMVNFGRMLWMDKSVLSEKQLDMLVKKRNSIEDKELEEYVDEFRLTDKDYVELDDGLQIHFKRTTLKEYCDSSLGWVNEIERQYNKSISSYYTEDERKAYLSSLVQARRLRKYEYMVSKITIPDVGEIVDRDTIGESLMALSTANNDFDTFEAGAIEYIEANSLAVVGYPTVPCESCHTVPETSEGRFKAIVPIATDRVFFTLVQRRTMVMNGLAQV